MSASTVRRWLAADAIKPWQHRSWIFPRDPDFAVKAGRVLDLYARTFDGVDLDDDEYVLSADEKSQQASCSWTNKWHRKQARGKEERAHDYQSHFPKPLY